MPRLPLSVYHLGRFVLIIALLGSLYLGGTFIAEAVEQYIQTWSAQKSLTALLGLTLLYAILLSIPFVPGVELGWAILMVLGVKGLVLVYPATVLGLCLSFFIGRWIPPLALERFLHWLHWYRIEQLLGKMRPLDSQNRLAMLLANTPRNMIPLLLRHRYLTLALAFNLPGNSLIGGGGGIALLAGVSRLFTPLAFVALVCFAITPIPLILLLLDWF